MALVAHVPDEGAGGLAPVDGAALVAGSTLPEPEGALVAAVLDAFLRRHDVAGTPIIVAAA
ncbi:MAG: hypothetical protein ACYCX8_04895, partial [Acidimicrobiales bacterium]